MSLDQSQEENKRIYFTENDRPAMSYKQIIDFSKGKFAIRCEDGEYRFPTDKEMKDANNYIRDQFTGKNDLSLHKRSRK